MALVSPTSPVIISTRAERKKRDTKVRARIFAEHNGRCHICAEKIQAGQGFELDHIIPLAMGGDDSEGNLAPAHPKCHRAKSSADQGDISQAKRRAEKHVGAKVPKQRLQGAGFTKAEPQRRATGKPTKQRAPLNRSIYVTAGAH